ncbi:MAG: Smr/MutS family protein, partial [Clostridia bacterium]|nr:Smr/MutS family protein [Clostridia bacterium]
GIPHVNTTQNQFSDESYIPKIGDEVLIIDMNQKATVLEAPDKNNEVLLLAGIMKIKMHCSNIKHLSAKETEKRLVNTFKLDKTDKNPSLEIDIRGLSADEVDIKVGKFLDDSALMSINEVFIIHGKGTGTLRSAVHTYLRKNPLVKSFRQGTFGEGESGVTVVILK